MGCRRQGVINLQCWRNGAGNKDLYGYPLQPTRSKGLFLLPLLALSLATSFMAACICLRFTKQGMVAEERKVGQEPLFLYSYLIVFFIILTWRGFSEDGGFVFLRWAVNFLEQ
ncbi:unnamed protein product [Victoria cruziana]